MNFLGLIVKFDKGTNFSLFVCDVEDTMSLHDLIEETDQNMLKRSKIEE